MMSLSTDQADSREFIKNNAFFNRIGFFPTIRLVPLYGMVQVQWQMARPTCLRIILDLSWPYTPDTHPGAANDLQHSYEACPISHALAYGMTTADLETSNAE